MITGILGKKIGMTQVFNEEGRKTPVTILEAGPCVVLAVKAKKKDGYEAVQLGFDDKREKSAKKPQKEYCKANGVKPQKFVREVPFDGEIDLKTGDIVTNEIFQKGDYLDVIAVSKGKGYQGGVRRCGWKGGCETHGSMSHAVPGSIGASTFPSRVVKGHPFPGHMGNERTTMQNLQVVEVDTEDSIIAVKGCVPGPNGRYVIIRFAKKRPTDLAARKKALGSKKESSEEGAAAEGAKE